MEQICSDWGNDDRMLSAFATFPDKSINPESFKRRYSFWNKLIIDTARHGLLHSEDRLLLHVEGLSSKFQRKGLVPLGLNTVIVGHCIYILNMEMPIN
jgi:hypothetical protein